MTKAIYLISHFDGAGVLLHRSAVEVHPISRFGEMEQAIELAAAALPDDRDLAEKSKHCEVKRATPEDIAEYGLGEAAP